MRITTITSYKGGVGKTMTAFNLSYNLAALGSRVLAVDTDPQGDLTFMCKKSTGENGSVYDLFQGKGVRKCIRRSRFLNLDLIASNSRVEEISADRPDILAKALEEIDGEYDYIIIDCHPSMQAATINAIYAANDLIVPLKPNRFERNGLEIMDSYISQIRELNPKIRFLGILFTMYAGRKSQKSVIEDILSKTKYPILDTVISAGEAANTSLECRKPLAMHRTRDRITADYQELMAEYIESGAEE